MRLALGVVLGALFVAALASAADLFDFGLKEAHANEASPEWRTYSGPFFEQLGPILQRAMQDCFPPSVNATGPEFTIVFAVRANGTLDQLMVRPESSDADCVLKRIGATQVPAPPRPDWWVFLDTKVTP